MEFITNNWKEIVLGLIALFEIIVRLTPTKKDNTILGIVKKIYSFLVPNRKKDGGRH